MWPNLKQKVRAVPPKPKLIVYIGRSQKSFLTGPSRKKALSLFNFQFLIFKFQMFKFQMFKFQIFKSMTTKQPRSIVNDIYSYMDM